MLRRLCETFTASHLVAIFAIAVLAPSLLYAGATFSNVAVVDAKTGARAHVDGNRLLRTYDPIAGYIGNPANIVNITDVPSSVSGLRTIYTVPDGMVLLIRSIAWVDYGNTEGNNTFYYLYDALNQFLFNTEGIHVANNVSARFDPGIVVYAGALKGFYTGPTGARVYIQGVLIPVNAAPAADQQVMIGKAASRSRPQ